ncbi:Beta-1,3-galactosyltransferase 1 [Armadillidium vulgare]|nr:Beta-1,3-galactosyltransferase 1 [Armadillidium vulgare]
MIGTTLLKFIMKILKTLVMGVGINYKKRMILLRNRKFIFFQLLSLVLFIIILYFIISYTITFKQKFAQHSNSKDYIWLEKHNNLSYFNRYVKKEDSDSRCISNAPVITVVISAPPNFSARNAVRKSWAKHLPKDWEVLFFVGLATSKDLKEEIENEKATFEDVIILDVQESYINLTLKLYLTFYWLHQHCQNSRFLIKVDDDVFLSPSKIKHLIHCSSLAMDILYDPLALQKCEETWDVSNLLGYFVDKKSRKYLSYIIGGYLYKNVKADRNPYSKWYLSKNLYNSEDLPDFLSGTAYFFSTNLLPYLLKAVSEVPAINLEDLYFTGLVMRKALNLKLSHIKGWNRFRPQWDDSCTYSKLVTAHGLSPDELVHITDKVSNIPNSCSLSASLFSLFNEMVSHYIPRYKL